MKLDRHSNISFDSKSLLVEGKPWYPVMGEMHYSRCPEQYWEEELFKMKAGGVDIVSLYTIWIHHEEIEGEWDFTGRRNLRRFLETVKQCGLWAFLRIGPWIHGEVRNGGFPDWLLEKERRGEIRTRSNDAGYLHFSKLFYEKIYEQARGFLLKDGGPVIGVQIENEFGHCGGLQGEEGERHMRALRAMAVEIGFDVPLYTATGWGGAVTGGMLPVMGGYCEAPWDQRTTEIEPNGNYIFTAERNDHNIGSDHGIGAGITFDMDKVPFLTAELGGGLQVTGHRRPVATGRDTGIMSMVKMGSGANLLGYYMYHGGTNPEGRLTTLEENRATGYPNDLPVKSYDFNAPVREFGQMEDTWRYVRRLALFVHEFGGELCRMDYVGQPGNPDKPTDLTSLRTAVRAKRIKDSSGNEINSGYLFVNNYQRHYPMAAHDGATLEAFLPEEDGVMRPYVSFDPIDIKDGDAFFYPFNLPMGESLLKKAEFTPLTVLHGAAGDGKDVYVFYGGSDRYELEGNPEDTRILLLSEEESLNAAKYVKEGREYLILAEDSLVTGADERAVLYAVCGSPRKVSFKTWPALMEEAGNFEMVKDSEEDTFMTSRNMASYESRKVYGCDMPVSIREADVRGADGERYAEISAGELDGAPQDILLSIDYTGNKARLFSGGRLIADNFYTGQRWEIGLKRFTDHEGRRDSSFAAEIEIKPLKEADKAGLYLEKWPVTEGILVSGIRSAECKPVYCVKI